ncbi:EF-hand domain-containing protein [Streptomyces sp. NPDC006530]|uniref:EF-hand domain-containing protein n=1 Tax=Streptomyces sp. NPDC006530 TaxID=3364750 RepID=UPI003690D9FA
MATDLLSRKITRHFDLIDTNGDGRISQEDFDLIVSRMGQEFAQAPDSPKYRALSDAYQALWQGMREALDTDGDGSVSREEYVAGMKADAATGAGYRQHIQPVAKAIISLCDTNGDGRLDGAELAKAHAGLGMGDADHEAAMERIDLDGDGYVTEAELAKAIEEFFLSEDSDAAGNHLFGRI